MAPTPPPPPPPTAIIVEQQRRKTGSKSVAATKRPRIHPPPQTAQQKEAQKRGLARRRLALASVAADALEAAVTLGSGSPSRIRKNCPQLESVSVPPSASASMHITTPKGVALSSSSTVPSSSLPLSSSSSSRSQSVWLEFLNQSRATTATCTTTTSKTPTPTPATHRAHDISIRRDKQRLPSSSSFSPFSPSLVAHRRLLAISAQRASLPPHCPNGPHGHSRRHHQHHQSVLAAAALGASSAVPRSAVVPPVWPSLRRTHETVPQQPQQGYDSPNYTTCQYDPAAAARVFPEPSPDSRNYTCHDDPATMARVFVGVADASATRYPDQRMRRNAPVLRQQTNATTIPAISNTLFASSWLTAAAAARRNHPLPHNQQHWSFLPLAFPPPRSIPPRILVPDASQEYASSSSVFRCPLYDESQISHNYYPPWNYTGINSNPNNSNNEYPKAGVVVNDDEGATNHHPTNSSSAAPGLSRTSPGIHSHHCWDNTNNDALPRGTGGAAVATRVSPPTVSEAAAARYHQNPTRNDGHDGYKNRSVANNGTTVFIVVETVHCTGNRPDRVDHGPIDGDRSQPHPCCTVRSNVCAVYFTMKEARKCLKTKQREAVVIVSVTDEGEQVLHLDVDDNYDCGVGYSSFHIHAATIRNEQQPQPAASGVAGGGGYGIGCTAASNTAYNDVLFSTNSK